MNPRDGAGGPSDALEAVRRSASFALVPRHLDDIVVRLVRVGYTEASVDRLERIAEACDSGRHPEGWIGDGALDGA